MGTTWPIRTILVPPFRKYIFTIPLPLPASCANITRSPSSQSLGFYSLISHSRSCSPPGFTDRQSSIIYIYLYNFYNEKQANVSLSAGRHLTTRSCMKCYTVFQNLFKLKCSLCNKCFITCVPCPLSQQTFCYATKNYSSENAFYYDMNN